VKQKQIELMGADVVNLERTLDRKLDLRELMEYLKQMGIKKVMVEGGATVITSFLNSDFIDQVVVTIAPIFVGGIPALTSPVFNIRIDEPHWQMIESDLVVWGTLKREGS
jgi:2,5-diamino-6-(ribosylamino)-4(3H)-pyrimidinone 5'-phosphate reductase